MNPSEKKALVLILTLFLTGVIADKVADYSSRFSSEQKFNLSLDGALASTLIEESNKIDEFSLNKWRKEAKKTKKTSASLKKSANNDKIVNINNADVKQLAELKGIGPKLAQAIIAYREAHGLFGKVIDLMKVKGIGKKKFKKVEKSIKID